MDSAFREFMERLKKCGYFLGIFEEYMFSMLSNRRNLDYAWLILAVCLFMMMCTQGTRTAMGVFVTPMEEDLQWSRADISRVLALGIFIGAMSFVVMGYLQDKYGSKKVICLSLVLLGASIMLTSRVNSIPSFALIFGVLSAFASSGVSNVTIHAFLARWFYKKRSLAISIASAGGSVGPLFFAPFTAYLIQTLDWRAAFLVTGGIILLIVFPLTVMFLRSNPHKVEETSGFNQDTQTDKVESEPVGPLFTTTWTQALKTAPIWQLSTAYWVCGVTVNIISIHFVPYAEDQGVQKIVAASIFGVMMGLNLIGVLSAGILSQIFTQRLVLGSAYAMRGLAYACLLLIGGIEGLWLFAVIGGLSWIATASTTSAMTADIYGVKNLGTINGITNMFHQIGGAISVFITGEIYGATGSYMIPFTFAALTLIPATISAFSVKEKLYSYRYNPVDNPIYATR